MSLPTGQVRGAEASARSRPRSSPEPPPRSRTEPPPRSRTVRLLRAGLTVAFLLAWLLAAFDNVGQVMRIGESTGRETARLAAVGIFIVLVLAAWVWQLRSADRWPPLVLFVVTMALFTVSDSGLGVVPLVAVALVVVTHRVGPVTGFACVAAATAWVVGILALYYRAEVPEIVTEGVATATVFSLVVVFAALLRQVETSERRAAAANEELRATNAELTAANERLHAAALAERDLVLAEERARTSRELHDGLGHQLTIVGMSLDYALRMRDREPDPAWEEVRRARVINKESLDVMRRWVRALHPPPHLPDATGPAAFDAIADSFRGTGLEVNVGYEGMEDPPPLPADVGLFAHRLVQEGLTNVLRHADAEHVQITMRQHPGRVEVSIVDDGTGTDNPGEGFGRRNLRERAEALGGSVTGRVLDGGGFEILAQVPLPELEAVS